MAGILKHRLVWMILKPRFSKVCLPCACAPKFQNYLFTCSSSASHAVDETSQFGGEKLTEQTSVAEQDSAFETPTSDLPVFLKVKYKSQRHEIESAFPDVCSLKEANLSKQEKHDKPDEESLVHFPYQVYSSLAIEDGKTNEIAKNEYQKSLMQEDLNIKREQFNETVSNWIKFLEENNVEGIKDIDGKQPNIQELKDGAWRFNYGSPDPSVPPSRFKCGGCGSVIHCQDVTIPGYIPSEKFKNFSKTTLKRTLCQRCTFLQEHNVALSVNVSKEHYTQVISKIKHSTALVLLLVDLTDFPCSIWPGIVDLIGKKCPIIVVGTKVDLIPKDGDKYLTRIKSTLSQYLKDWGVDRGGNLLDIHLVSGKTYYGVESLINKIFQHWSHKGDVFLVGCTNVGKSTLFNALLQSDLCNISAVDLIQRATTSVWPGTTLNLLKFPIRKMSGLSLVRRNQRLLRLSQALKQERLLRESMYQVTNNPKYATILGRIEVTGNDYRTLKESSVAHTFCSADDRKFAGSHFCYDTPGTVYTDQILDLLTVEELVKILPNEMIIPRTFSIKARQTLFLGGLARIDVLHVQNIMNILITVFSTDKLPVYIVATKDADLFYKQYLGTLLEVPFGSAERLACFPKLKPHQFQCTGTRFDENCVDVVLSSIGWVSITARKEEHCQFLAYTPEGRGCYLRQPPLLPLAVRLRSCMIGLRNHIKDENSIVINSG